MVDEALICIADIFKAIPRQLQGEIDALRLDMKDLLGMRGGGWMEGRMGANPFLDNMFSVGLRKALITTLEDIGEVMHSIQIQIWTRLRNVLISILSTALGSNHSK